MKKKDFVWLGVAALLFFAFRKKKTTKGSIELGDLDEGDFIDPKTGKVITIPTGGGTTRGGGEAGLSPVARTLAKIREVFSDNGQPLQDASYIEIELNRLNSYQLSVIDNYFKTIIEGGVQNNLIEVDNILQTMPNLLVLLAQGAIYNKQQSGTAQRFGVDDGMNLLQSIATGNVVGIISGAAKLFDSIFCGRKCRARRAALIQ